MSRRIVLAIFASYGQADTAVDETTPPGTWVHHPQLGIRLKDEMDRVGVECHLQYRGGPIDPQYKSPVEFMIDKLNK